MQIRLSSVLVDDQEKALRFYTSVLGFVKDKDIPMGPFRCLTVNSPEGAQGMELVLEPMSFPPALTYQKALFDAGTRPLLSLPRIFRLTLRGSKNVV